MTKYEMLVCILDRIRAEASGTKFEVLYAYNSTDTGRVWQARSRAYIHLYLKVMFGITDFQDRETRITDGSGDGGIDGYFVDEKSYNIILIQSKFRLTEENFEKKPIELKEILSMQIKRILGGESVDENGVKYNGKILGLQRQLSKLPSSGRYQHRVVIIANVAEFSDQMLMRLTDGFKAEIVNFQESYNQLLFPVLSGTLFKATEINIPCDLSRKSVGSKISYPVRVANTECEIKVVFVPTLEIAKMMSLYKNSILHYNPRSYLEFEGERVNTAIRDTLALSKDNEFALYNNGITIICDGSGINDWSGVKDQASLHLVNPQIINGGQTAYTLSRVFDGAEEAIRNDIFAGKEVLVKVITLPKSGGVLGEVDRISLIEKISFATNSQNTITMADRTSNNALHYKIQSALFDRYGLLYERKKGEFSDGLRSGYIILSDIVNKNVFLRVYLAANGKLIQSLKSRISIESIDKSNDLEPSQMDRFAIAFYAYEWLRGNKSISNKKRNIEILPKVFAASIIAQYLEGDAQTKARVAAGRVQQKWSPFLSFMAAHNATYIRTLVNSQTGGQQIEIKESRGSFSGEFIGHAESFFGADFK